MQDRGNHLAYYFSKLIRTELEKKKVISHNMAMKFDELNKTSFSINTVDKTVDNSVDKLKRV